MLTCLTCLVNYQEILQKSNRYCLSNQSQYLFLQWSHHSSFNSVTKKLLWGFMTLLILFSY